MLFLEVELEPPFDETLKKINRLRDQLEKTQKPFSIQQLDLLKKLDTSLKPFNTRHQDLLKKLDASLKPFNTQQLDRIKKLEAALKPFDIQKQNLLQSIETANQNIFAPYQEFLNKIEHQKNLFDFAQNDAQKIFSKLNSQAIDALKISQSAFEKLQKSRILTEKQLDALTNIESKKLDLMKTDKIHLLQSNQIKEKAAFFHTTPSAELGDFVSSIQELAKDLEKSNNPSLLKFFKEYIYPIIVGLALLFLDQQLTVHRELDKQTKKEIEKSLVDAIDPIIKEDNQYRFVSATILLVRSGASRNHQVIGQLQYASVVRILDKQKSWSLVEWSNSDSSLEIRGWVFTRYLKRFR